MGRRARRPTVSLPELAAAGWVLPVTVAGSAPPRAPTAVGTIGSGPLAAVDGRGLVSPAGEGWSLDWWVGADDRWHRPTAEGAVRQRLIDAAPVVESVVRIPGGEARHRAYGVRVGDDDVVVVEVENASSVPFALALAIRPFTAAGVGAVRSISLEAIGGGRGRDVAQVVTVDGHPALLLPRAPARAAAGSSAVGDIAAEVGEGRAGTAFPGAHDEVGQLATAAFLFPVPHRTTFRVALPVGPAPGGRAPAWPGALPDAARVASGWARQAGRAPRLEIPDARVLEGVEATRRALLLAAGGESISGDLAAIAALVVALDGEGFADEAARLLATWPDRLAGARLTAATATAVLGAVVDHWRLTRHTGLAESLLPELVTAVGVIERDPAAAGAQASVALAGLAQLLAALGQARAARRFSGHGTRSAPSHDPRRAWEALAGATRSASPTWTWTDPSGAASFLTLVRRVLVDDDGADLAVLPAGPGPWYGQGVELHGAPTAAGRFSFAVRWHGDRPALLWELQPHADLDVIAITAPGLDPGWRTTDRRGDALLAPVPAPAGLAPPYEPVPAGMGSAEAVAPRSLLPMPGGPSDPPSSPPGSAGEPGRSFS